MYAAFEESPVDERDLAEVAAGALLSDEPAGGILELTGPQSLSHQQMVAVIGGVIGRPLRFQEIPPEAAAQGMVQRAGLPEPFVVALMARYAKHVRQAQYPATGELAKILGHPAREFAEWAADHAAAFRL